MVEENKVEVEISLKEQEIIRDAITISSQYANGGVRTIVYPDGTMSTNYVHFREHQWVWTQAHSEFVIKTWNEVYRDKSYFKDR